MQIVTIIATLMKKGISYVEKAENATQKGAKTFVTEHGTYINDKKFMTVQETLNNTFPTYKPAMMGYKIVCLPQDVKKAKKLLFEAFDKRLTDAGESIEDLLNGLMVEQLRMQEEFDKQESWADCIVEPKRKRRVK